MAHHEIDSGDSGDGELGEGTIEGLWCSGSFLNGWES